MVIAMGCAGPLGVMLARTANSHAFIDSCPEGCLDMPEPGFRDLERRLETLERINRETERKYRRWKRLGIGLLGCGLAVALAGAADQKPGTVEAREFVLRDENGVMRASLTIRPDGTPGFGLFDKNGKVRLSFDLDAEGKAGLNLHDGEGTLRAAVATRPDGTPGIGLFGSRGQVRASLDVGRNGTSGVNVYDDAGTLRAAMAMRPDATPAVGLFDEKGRVQRSIESGDKPKPACPSGSK
jgi:hypothetical protein